MERFDKIREYERDYHDHLYATTELWQSGSWLAHPIASVIQVVEMFQNKNISVLDIGCGVGRHAIPIAKTIGWAGWMVVGMDLLDSAHTKLQENREQYGISEHVLRFDKADIENYAIEHNRFDYIFAVSCLEHVSSKETLQQVLRRMAEGTKPQGVNYIIISVDNTLFDPTTEQYLDPMIETNISANEAITLLEESYNGWEVLDCSVKSWQSIQTHTKQWLIQRGESIRFMCKKQGL